MFSNPRILILASLTAILLFVWAGNSPGESKDETKGKILTPKEGTSVERAETFKVRARVKNVPKGYRVYACIEVKDLLWPKEEPLSALKKGGEWTTTISEGGEAKEFRLTV